MTKTLLLFIAMIVWVPCQAFEVEGFKTGMSKTTVIAMAEKNHKLVTADENTLIANSANGSYLSFNFCEDKLVSVQLGYQPNLRQVALLVSELNKNFGQPFSISSGVRAHSSERSMKWGCGGTLALNS